MKYPLRNKRKNKTLLYVVLFIIIVFYLITFFYPNLIPGKFNSLGRPLWQFRELVLENLNELKSILNSKSSLVIENKELKEEVLTKNQKLLEVELLKKENEELKNILGRNTSIKRIVARVLSKTNQSLYDTLIIDIGDLKTKVGQEVFSGNSILIGTIDKVYSNTARVKLLSAPGNKYEVQLGEEAIPAIAEGLGKGNFEIKLPRGVDVNVGDEIVSPNLSIKLLGIVEYIDSTPQNSIQKILFKSPININQIKWVEIDDA